MRKRNILTCRGGDDEAVCLHGGDVLVVTEAINGWVGGWVGGWFTVPGGVVEVGGWVGGWVGGLPVGVAMMRPSAWTVVTYWPLQKQSREAR